MKLACSKDQHQALLDMKEAIGLDSLSLREMVDNLIDYGVSKGAEAFLPQNLTKQLKK